MKKFQFTLKKLYEYKASFLDKEKNTLAIFRTQLRAIEATIAKIEKQFEAVSGALTQETQQGIRCQKMQSYKFQLENSRIQLKMLNLDRLRQEALVQKQLKQVIKLSQEVSELEKLEETQLEQYRVELAKADELLISEYLSSKIAREQSL